MMNLLQIGGKCGVIVPDGVLFGTSNAHKKLRQLLLEKCQLEAVISMPSGVFKPYAGVSTVVLVLIKGDKTEKVLEDQIKTNISELKSYVETDVMGKLKKN